MFKKEKKHKGVRAVTAVLYVPLSVFPRKGKIADVDAIKQCLRTSLSDFEDGEELVVYTFSKISKFRRTERLED